VLEDILSKLPPSAKFPNLLVGVETGDDSAVYKINDDQAIVATTDFFMPIVDDPYDFGRISATNALSDVYAIGGKPVMALAIAGFPVNVMTDEDIAQVLAGGAAVCEAAGVPVAGGHTIDAKEPIYGLAVIGMIHPDKIKRNSDGRAGDVLISWKRFGCWYFGRRYEQGRARPARLRSDDRKHDQAQRRWSRSSCAIGSQRAYRCHGFRSLRTYV
jgi:selenide,water dikinase